MLGDCHLLETVGGASKEKSLGFGRVNKPRLDPGDYPFEYLHGLVGGSTCAVTLFGPSST